MYPIFRIVIVGYHYLLTQVVCSRLNISVLYENLYKVLLEHGSGIVPY